MSEVYLTTAEMARILNITPATLRLKAAHGVVPCLRIGRTYRFRATEVVEALARDSSDDWRMSSQSMYAQRAP